MTDTVHGAAPAAARVSDAKTAGDLKNYIAAAAPQATDVQVGEPLNRPAPVAGWRLSDGPTKITLPDGRVIEGRLRAEEPGLAAIGTVGEPGEQPIERGRGGRPVAELGLGPPEPVEHRRHQPVRGTCRGRRSRRIG